MKAKAIDTTNNDRLIETEVQKTLKNIMVTSIARGYEAASSVVMKILNDTSMNDAEKLSQIRRYCNAITNNQQRNDK